MPKGMGYVDTEGPRRTPAQKVPGGNHNPAGLAGKSSGYHTSPPNPPDPPHVGGSKEDVKDNVD